MFDAHYPALVGGYLAALLGWFACHRLQPGVWPASAASHFDRPWREFGYAVLGGVGVIGIGQLWAAGVRLPESGPARPLTASLNQLLIFAPILAVPVIRRQPWGTAWLGPRKIPHRLLVGVILASVAVTAYALLRKGGVPPWEQMARTCRLSHLDVAVQVFLEDVTIAILFVRFSAAAGPKWAVGVVACLFAAGHVPAMAAGGATAAEFLRLGLDAALGVAVLSVLRHSRDILWFWPVHFCLDTSQFDGVVFPA